MIEARLQDGAGGVDETLLPMANALLDTATADELSSVAELLVRVCSVCFQAGRSRDAIDLGRRVAKRTDLAGDLSVRRKIHNVLGAYYVDAADFTAAMHSLRIALSISNGLGDPVLKAASLANVGALLQEMGHYRDAIDVVHKVLSLASESDLARALKVQGASTGLYSAHRIGDTVSARLFLSEGEKYLSHAFGPLGRAFFEKERALYLIDSGQAAAALKFIERAFRELDGEANVRVGRLLELSRSLCQWSNGDKSAARSALRALHAESRKTGLYHQQVLQALVKAYSDATTSDEVAVGLAFAKELIEFTTSVKKAKFYRQLSDRPAVAPEPTSTAPSENLTETEPFGSARHWLTEQTNIGRPVDRAEALATHEELTAIHEDMARLRMLSTRREIRTDAVDTAENWAVAAEYFDDATGQHCYRVGHLASMLAREIGMDETFCIRVEHAARLHDIGKIAVNELILLKPGPLDAAEMAAMRLHTEVGAQILAGSDDPTLRMAADVARHHHEWWNGCGYPAKLAGGSIPIAARVCAYADVYDALTHARAYKTAWTHDRAVAEIERLSGTQFDPDLLAPFLNALVRYREDLEKQVVPAFVDMKSNALIASRKKLMDAIAADHS